MSIDPVSLAITAALTAANMALQMTRKIEGPRLDDLNVTVADYGTPKNYFYGIRRFEGVPIIWAEEIRENKRRRKTKGGKYNEYTYYGTWAVLVADHPTDGITRYWFDKHLVYDVTGAGPVTPTSLGFTVDENIRIYLGGEDQEPDPRMQAWVDAKHGAGSCPAYRGMTIVVFEDVPLEKVGNRIPQQSAEAVAHGNTIYPYQQETVQEGKITQSALVSFSPNGALVGWNTGTSFEVWDTASRTPVAVFDLAVFDSDGVSQPDTAGHHAIANNGNLYGQNGDHLVAYPDIGAGAGLEIAALDGNGAYVVAIGAAGREYICTAAFSSYSTNVLVLPDEVFSSVDTSDIFPEGWIPRGHFADVHGDVYAVGTTFGSSVTTCYLLKVADNGGPNPSMITIDAPTVLGSLVHEVSGFDAGPHFVIFWEGHMLAVDPSDGSILIDEATGLAPDPGHVHTIEPGAPRFWISGSEFDSLTLEVIRSVTYTDWLIYSAGSPVYDRVNHAIMSSGASGAATDVTWFFLDRLGSDGVTLQEIVEDVCERCGLDPEDYDASDLDQVIPGWSWTQGPGKDIIAPLLDLYDSDARTHNFGLEFVKRGGAAAGTIDTDEFVRNGDEPRYSITRAQDTDLPRSVSVSFADIDADQQTNTVLIRRALASVDGVREATVDMTTLALDADTARQLGERYFRRAWNATENYSLGLTAQRLALEPGDVWNLNFDDEVERTARLTKTTFSAGAIKTEWERDDPEMALLSSVSGAAMDGREPQVILTPMLSKGFYLDIPLIADADNDTNPILYYAAGPFGSGAWPGAAILEGEDGEADIAAVPSDAAATWGHATDALDDANPWLWDRGNSVNVKLLNGELISATEAECDASPRTNLALLGDEMIQFATATLEGDGTYTLTGLKRGRRGTEWATAGHSVGDRFLLLDAVGNVERGLSDVGSEFTLRAVTSGRDVDSAFRTDLTFTGASHKPYAPVHVRAVKDSITGDWNIAGVRRSRIGGAWVGGTTVPLGESSEAYEMDVMDGDDVVRTMTSATLSFLYTTAMQTADFGGSVAVGDLDVRVYQISASVDRGYPTALAA